MFTPLVNINLPQINFGFRFRHRRIYQEKFGALQEDLLAVQQGE